MPRILAMVLLLGCAIHALAAETEFQVPPAPARTEGDGPYSQLILRSATVINGTGTPAFGPTDIVIEGNRIVNVFPVGSPGGSKEPPNRPKLKAGGREIDLRGHYVLPGLVDMHGHIGGKEQAVPSEYVYKLWMGHGITTIRDPGCGNGVEWTLEARGRSAANQITAPRVFVYVRPGAGWSGGTVDSPAKAREYVQWAAKKGVDGFKLGSHDPEIMAALIDEAKKHGLGTQAHLGQLGVARM